MYGSESWTIKKAECWTINWCFWIVVLEKTFERPLESKEIKPVNPKQNQPGIFIRRTDAEAEVPKFWLPDVKGRLIGKDPDAGKDWGQEEKRVTEDEMIGWPYRLDGHEFEQTLGDSEGQGSMACCSPWGHRVRHDWATELTDLLFWGFPTHFCHYWVLSRVVCVCSRFSLVFYFIHTSIYICQP